MARSEIKNRVAYFHETFAVQPDCFLEELPGSSLRHRSGHISHSFRKLGSLLGMEVVQIGAAAAA